MTPVADAVAPRTQRDAAEHPDLSDTRLRLWVAIALTAPLVAVDLAPHLLPTNFVISRWAVNWMGCLLGTPVVFWSGWRFFVKAAEAIKARTVSALQLTAFRTGGAWAYSVVAILAPSLFPSWMRTADGSVAAYFEAAAVMTVFVLLSQLLELRSTLKPSAKARCCEPISSAACACCA